jgi:hypothetical protein
MGRKIGMPTSMMGKLPFAALGNCSGCDRAPAHRDVVLIHMVECLGHNLNHRVDMRLVCTLWILGENRTDMRLVMITLPWWTGTIKIFIFPFPVPVQPRYTTFVQS